MSEIYKIRIAVIKNWFKLNLYTLNFQYLNSKFIEI